MSFEEERKFRPSIEFDERGYLESMPAYNLDFIKTRKRLQQNLTQKDIYNLLFTLNYNISNNRLNFRCGYRYYSKEKQEFTWHTSDVEGFDQYMGYDTDKREYVLKRKWAKIYKSQILKHFLKKPLARRIGWYDKNDFNYLDYKKTEINAFNINKKIFGTTQIENSNVLWLDIDNRNDESALIKLKKILKLFHIKLNQLMFLEQNVFTGGIHAFLKLSENIYSNQANKIEKYCKQNGIPVETDFSIKILRLPFSYEYVPIKLNNRIFTSKTPFIDEKYFYNTLKEAIDNIKFSYVNLSYIYNPIPTPISNKELYRDYWNITPLYFYKNNKKIKLKSNNLYKITKGNRWELTKKLVPYLKAQGYSLEDTAKLILKQNVDSIDLSKWSLPMLTANIKSFYNKADVKCLINNSKNFYSNISLLNDYDINLLNKPGFINWFVDSFNDNYIQIKNKTDKTNIKSLSNAKLKALKLQMPLILKEILGKLHYDEFNPKRLDVSVNFNTGIQFSDTFIANLINYVNDTLHLNGREYNHSIQYFKKTLIKTLKLNTIRQSYGRSWKNGFCKSYSFYNGSKSIQALLDNLFNRFLSIDLNYSYINIYNILPEPKRVEYPPALSKEEKMKKILEIMSKCQT